ncbi:hypothetical protein ACIQF6_24835 [Kitasatospora sp. NPDC092948]|uniref:hypothetical protein n=1 Tax=Kitasatospora sp. NPDC092948 TaxID=3364088 RepID=UPI0038100D46
MTVPDLIPIAYEPHYRTDTIGHWAGGQFLAHVTWAPARTGCWVVLHTFDPAGRHLGSTVELVPVPGDSDARLHQLLDGLPGREYGDIAIAPFAEHRDGDLFGLVLESHGEYPPGEEQFDWAELYPCRLGFGAPWDGTYDT